MVYELTLSDNPKKAICRQESARVKGNGVLPERIITEKNLTETIALPTHQVGTTEAHWWHVAFLFHMGVFLFHLVAAT